MIVRHFFYRPETGSQILQDLVCSTGYVDSLKRGEGTWVKITGFEWIGWEVVEEAEYCSEAAKAAAKSMKK